MLVLGSVRLPASQADPSTSPISTRLLAVSGMTCMRPMAPAEEVAVGFQELSHLMTAHTRSGSTPCLAAEASMAATSLTG